MRKSIFTLLMAAMLSMVAFSPVEAFASSTEQEHVEKEVCSTATQIEGVTYKWHGNRDETAEIYEIVCGDEDVVLHIPQEVDGYVVTSITGNAEGKDIIELTIPESVTWFGEDTFAYTKIRKLNYNAESAACEEDFFFCPFARAEIGEICFGSNVERVGSFIFYETDFLQENLVLQVPEIGAFAFHSTSIQALTLGEEIKVLEESAFEDSEIAFVSYECKDAVLKNVNELTAPFVRATIGGLKIADTVEEIPAYLFANTALEISELTINQKKIGDMAFYSVWEKEGAVGLQNLTVTDVVTFVGEGAFSNNWIQKLCWNASAESNAKYGIFDGTDILELEIGEDVKVLPTYCFADASLYITEFQLSVPVIGEACFLNAWVTDKYRSNYVALEITNEVEQLGNNAFAGCRIVSLIYGASSKTTATDSFGGPFYEAEVSELILTDQAELLDSYVFAGMHLKQKDLVIPDSVNSIQRGVFASGWNRQKVQIEHLKIGAGVKELSCYAFEGLSFDTITVEAVKAGEEFYKQFVFADTECLPGCSQLYIHKGSDYQNYFETNAGTATYFCTDYMEQVEGDVYLDEETGTYMKPTYNICSVCGYEELLSAEVVDEVEQEDQKDGKLSVPIAASATAVTGGTGAVWFFFFRRRRKTGIE